MCMRLVRPQFVPIQQQLLLDEKTTRIQANINLSNVQRSIRLKDRLLRCRFRFLSVATVTDRSFFSQQSGRDPVETQMYMYKSPVRLSQIMNVNICTVQEKPCPTVGSISVKKNLHYSHDDDDDEKM
jgi:hypothetical protein